MRVFKDLFIWLKGGIQGGQLIFWMGVGLYAVFVLMLWQSNFAPVDVQTGAILTLSVLAFCEASIKFGGWCADQEAHPHKADWLKWASWARPFALVHLMFAWIVAFSFGYAAPLDAILVGLALVIFGLAKTLPGVNISGVFGNVLLLVSIALPCFIVAGMGHAFGL